MKTKAVMVEAVMAPDSEKSFSHFPGDSRPHAVIISAPNSGISTPLIVSLKLLMQQPTFSIASVSAILQESGHEVLDASVQASIAPFSSGWLSAASSGEEGRK